MKKNEDFMTSLSERIHYWFFFIGQNIYYTAVFTFLPTFMMFQGVDLTKTGAVMLVTKLWDAINDPLFGVIFDKAKFKSGKCLPWIRVSAGLMPVTIVLLFMNPANATEFFKLLWYAVAYLLYDTFYTISDVPIYSMVTTMTKNLNERNSIMSLGRIFSGVGMGIATIFFTILVGEKVGMSFKSVAVISCIIALIFTLPICLKGKERMDVEKDGEESFSVSHMFKYLIHNKYLLIYYSGFFFSNALLTSNAISLFVCYYLFGSANFNIIIGALGIIPGGIAALLIPRLTKRFDKFKVLFWSNNINLLIGLIIFFIGWENKTMFLVLTVARSVFSGVVGILNFMFTPDCAEYGQYKTGINAKGITFAIQTFSAKITAAVSTSLALFVLKFFDWREVIASSFEDLQNKNIFQPDRAMNGLWITYILVPVIGMAVSVIFYLLYKLNDRDVQVMADYNAGNITREEADSRLSRKY